MFAGKVHGSLARAGKVRGQTPKVPKQEKKKKPTGRAMKRIKYNRRFVNVGALQQLIRMALGPKTGDQLLLLLLLACMGLQLCLAGALSFMAAAHTCLSM